MELKFDPGFRVIGEYMSPIDSILRVNFKTDSSNISVKYSPITRNLARILVPLRTQLIFECPCPGELFLMSDFIA